MRKVNSTLGFAFLGQGNEILDTFPAASCCNGVILGVLGVEIETYLENVLVVERFGMGLCYETIEMRKCTSMNVFKKWTKAG